MNVFFSPSVSSYQVLAPHFQACEIVQKLIQTNNVQFELNLYDDPSDPFFFIYSRVKSMKLKLSKMIQLIQTKYNQQIRQLSMQDRFITISKMKQYIRQHKIDHLKYLDHEEHELQTKMSQFYLFSQNYDTFLRAKLNYEQQIDTLREKVEVCNSRSILQQFTMISGVCKNKNIASLEKILFRQSKGHSVSIFKTRKQDSTSSVFLCLINKNIFKHIGIKLTKSCELNEVNLYDLPNNLKSLLQHEQLLMKKLRQSQQMLQMSGRQLTAVLHQSIVGQGVNLRQHMLRISYLQRVIYIICHSKHIGNPSNHVLFQFYVPALVLLPKFSAAIFPMQDKKVKNRTIMPRLNCLKQMNILTQLFSIPKHNQIIPSVFMFVTVPFLFGMMFSDFGHGIFLLFACYFFNLGLVFYIMSFMSIYCGIIYNQFFGMKIIRWSNLGIVQPVWAVSQNGLNFENSLKMKLSMVVAFVHMTFGMVLKIVNQNKKGQTKKIIYDSLPKLGLLFTTVGYLVVLIIKKWLTNYQGSQSTAPSIINSLLQLYLGWNPQRKHSIFGSIETQHKIGTILNNINIFLILVLVYNQTIRSKTQSMLYSVFINGTNRKNKVVGYRELSSRQKDKIQVQDQSLDFQMSQQLQNQKKQAYKSLQNLQQIHFHQQQQQVNQLGPLEVFQFVLSLISSTTSYLRLFALSLAHAKLSSLILDMLLSTLSGPQPYISLIRCIAFFMITIGMMLTLDVMECMMHVVRLHWVEWMGKFYTGSGKLFIPQTQYHY